MTEKLFATIRLDVFVGEGYCHLDAVQDLNDWIEQGRGFGRISGKIKIKSAEQDIK